MKRFFAILFAVLYITLTSGVAVNVHYCMGKLASVEWQDTPADHCQKCGKPAKGMDCCKDEFKFCKVTESHQAAKVLQQGFNPGVDLQLPVRILNIPAAFTQQLIAGVYPHDPPEPATTPIFLKNCIFRI
ncbi:HYC_CC_PP family protein [Chitinophaga sp. 30R24]|uniref:HYC_CC_PP family protein n=1 Tax=Chitinophaga sp. 30R24 TaxID=3248838 RepID=UPI003B9205BD